MGIQMSLIKIFLTLSIVGSITLLDLIIHLLLSAIGLIKVLTGLHDLVMGMTIVSVGNCFPGNFSVN